MYQFFGEFQTSQAELNCLEEYSEISYECQYTGRIHPKHIMAEAKHLSKKVAKKMAKDQCEKQSGRKCIFDYCYEKYGLYSKFHYAISYEGKQFQEGLGGRSYNKQVRADKAELKKLRQEALEKCSN